MKPWIPPLLFGLSAGASLALALKGLGSGSGDEDAQHYAEVREFVRESAVHAHSLEDLSEAALRGLAASLDEYSQYFDKRDSKTLERETLGSYRGIGAVFRAPVSQGQVLFTLEGSPARRAGLRPGDRIVRVEGQPVEELAESGFRELLSRDDPPVIHLEVVALSGSSRNLALRRSLVVDPTVRRVELIDASHHIGYLAISAFSHETPTEFDAAVDSLIQHGATSVVLDLRCNPGGVLLAAVEVARRFVADGPLVTTEGRGHRSTQQLAEQGKAWYHGLPVVVLIDERSASASEVLAGALQDHRVAVVLGERSFGKGTVQTIRRFPQTGDIVKVTSAYYFTPAHRCLERTAAPNREGGIEPDYVVAVSPEERRGVHAFLASYSPPPEEVEALHAWEAMERVKLVETRPTDAQLESALSLLRGEKLAASPLN